MNDDTPGRADVPVGSGSAEEGRLGRRPSQDGSWDGSREWYSRGYLLHRDELRLIQSVTFRLVDSLPQKKLKLLSHELAHIEGDRVEIERRKRIEEWLDAGMGCCALAHPEVARFVQNTFLHFHGERYHLHAWCIMPNHVHILIEPMFELAAIVQGWKSFTARWILRQNQRLGLQIPESNQFWMREYWDRYIRDANHYQKVVEYIHQNPVKAKLCRVPEDWPWSSGNGRVWGNGAG
jgi:type I restriction enzyme R subunit/putative DNA methylase